MSLQGLTQEQLTAIWERILDLIDEYRDAGFAMDGLRAEQPPKIIGAIRPPQGTKFETFDEYASDIERRVHQQAKHYEIQEKIDKLGERRNAIIKDLLGDIPAEVWFRNGDEGFGIQVGDWGGTTYALKFSPWAEKMPTLNNRTRD